MERQWMLIAKKLAGEATEEELMELGQLQAIDPEVSRVIKMLTGTNTYETSSNEYYAPPVFEKWIKI